MSGITVATKHPIAVDSPDHLYPCGVKSDNNTNSYLIAEIEQRFSGGNINILDLGCAGGQLIVDFASNGHTSVGLEGSDYALRKADAAGHANWVEHYGEILFTCDISKQFSIMSDGSPMLFDCIMAWEFLEHIRREELQMVLDNVKRHLKPSGLFCGSLYWDSFKGESGVELHQTTCPKEVWFSEILSPTFSMVPYPFLSALRGCSESVFGCEV